ncbi:TonB-dependent receptor domain-containing protein [Larkinella sp. VNQ87]|uniref:TonB-dependent receptor domain-containing protein n=1 Tax=Larkinella sp. VNQ87 TaxID=3400921 RepID=UPI003BFE6A2E
MKPFVLVFLLLIVVSVDLQAQKPVHQGTVKGIIADSLTQQPVPFATVSLFRGDSLVNGTLTDSLGRFELQWIPYGTYRLTFSLVGYRPVQSPILTLNAEQTVLDVGQLMVSQDAKLLKTVTIRGQKPLIEQRADGITFNAESLPALAGSDASDVLRKVPLLTIDANGGLSMRGSSQIRVFIDGKPSDLYASSVADALKSISGETIVKVEVITHPSARYDAEGTDGVVNIITRKSLQNATNGNIRLALANRSENVMADLQHQSGKWLLKADAFYQLFWNRNGAVLNRESESFRVVQTSESRQLGDYFFGGLKALYSLDSLNTLDFGYRSRGSSFRTKTVADNFHADDETLQPSFQRKTDSPVSNDGNTFNVGYTGQSKDKRKEFSFIGLYFAFTGTNRYELEQQRGQVMNYRENFDSKTRNRDLSLQIDYSHSFTDRWKWETGGKLVRKALDSDSRFGIYGFADQQYANDPTRSNAFSYESRVYAGYTSVNLSLKKWQFTAGTRYEKTDLTASFKDVALRIPSFHNLVPNLLINHNVSPKSSLKLSYSVKLNRPYFSILNPTVNNSDSLNRQFGNPQLQPEITRRYQLTYSRNSTRLFMDIGLFYNDNRNSIESIRTARPDGVFESTWQNIGRNRRLGLALNLTWKPSTQLNLSATLTPQYVWLESRALNLTNHGLMRELVLNGTYKLPHGFSIDFYGFFDANNLRLQGYRTGWKYYSLTFGKESKNKRLVMALRMDTILTPHTFIREETATDAFRQTQTYRLQNQHIRLTIAYKLGRKEIKGPRVRTVENPD